MHLAEFIATHMPALEQDEVRHNLMLAILARAAKDPSMPLLTWTLGAPGACAIKSPSRPIILGEFGQDHCRALADATQDLDTEGVAGLGLAPQWFVERAVELGKSFADPVPQRIHALRHQPVYPGAAGHARQVLAEDGSLFADWLIAFSREAVPNDPVSSRAELEKIAGEGRHMFWVVENEPPAQRGRGYAGSVTAAVAERVFAEGKTAACLYTDLRNPASNRCYAKIGFKPVCDAWVYRQLAAKAAS